MIAIRAHLPVYEGFSDLPGSRQAHLTLEMQLPAVPRTGELVNIGDFDHRVRYVWYERDHATVRIEFERCFAGHDGFDEILTGHVRLGWT